MPIFGPETTVGHAWMVLGAGVRNVTQASSGHARACSGGAQECPIELTLLFLIQFPKSQVLLSSLMKSKNFLTKLNY